LHSSRTAAKKVMSRFSFLAGNIVKVRFSVAGVWTSRQLRTKLQRALTGSATAALLQNKSLNDVPCEQLAVIELVIEK
jgi:hypothetical protein